MIFARDSQTPFRVVVAAVLLVGSLLGPGCATAPQAVKARVPLVADLSPVAVALAPREAWRRADSYAQSHPGSRVMVGRGGSMLPQYEDHTILVVQTMEQAELCPGMTVVFVGDSGRQVAHTLVQRGPSGWVAMGVGNPEPDRTPVRFSNYVGTVIGAFLPRSDLAEPASLPISGQRVAMAN